MEDKELPKEAPNIDKSKEEASPAKEDQTGADLNKIPTEMIEKIELLRKEVHKVLVGQEALLDLILVGVLSDGHLLLEGVPGIAKTLASKLVAKAIKADFGRVQFTPDLMPSDVTGTSIYNSSKNEFEFKKGPIFNNLVLIDEINRAPAKTQAALFECMEERQVSVDGVSYALDEPFLVLATQNPIDSEGTYQLPEAQLDRFLFKVKVKYPTLEEEVSILQAAQKHTDFNSVEKVDSVLNKADMKSFKKVISSIEVDPKLIQYIAKLVNLTREDKQLMVGASPRASLGLLKAAKAMAFLNGRDFVIPDDIKEIAYPIFRHRLILTPEKEIEGVKIEQVVEGILEQVEIPR